MLFKNKKYGVFLLSISCLTLKCAVYEYPVTYMMFVLASTEIKSALISKLTRILYLYNFKYFFK
jgi:hypothetical protein